MKQEQYDVKKIIADIMQKYPEKEWKAHCTEALSDMSDISIMATIEILAGGDVYDV